MGINTWGSTYKGFRDPMVGIKVESRDLDLNTGKKGMYVTNVHVQKSVGCEASTCVFQVLADAVGNEDYKPPFLSTLKAGAKLEVSLGYSGKLKPVFVGYITSIDIGVSNDKKMNVSVTGMDGKVWMMANRQSALKKDIKKYTGAVKDTFKNYTGKFSGSNIKVSDEPDLSSPIYQYRESDYEFVCRMAYLAGALFFVDNGKFNFVDMYSGKSSNTSFDNKIISNINSAVNLWGIPKKVETVVQNNKKFKEIIKGTALQSNDIGKGRDATKVSKNVDSVVTNVKSDMVSSKEADFASKVEQNRRNFNLVTVRVGLMYGVPELELGKTYKMEKIGDPFNNEFMLTGVEHIMSSDKYESIVYLNSTRYAAP